MGTSRARTHTHKIRPAPDNSSLECTALFYCTVLYIVSVRYVSVPCTVRVLLFGFSFRPALRFTITKEEVYPFLWASSPSFSPYYSHHCRWKKRARVVYYSEKMFESKEKTGPPSSIRQAKLVVAYLIYTAGEFGFSLRFNARQTDRERDPNRRRGQQQCCGPGKRVTSSQTHKESFVQLVRPFCSSAAAVAAEEEKPVGHTKTHTGTHAQSMNQRSVA